VRFAAALARFARAHAEDPRGAVSRDYHARLGAWVERLAAPAEPGEALQLAAACQHIRRWTIPRDRFPEGVAGYKRWRSELARFHAGEAAAILAEVGYDEAAIARVRSLLLKKDLKGDAEVQLFEDAICLTFLEGELEAFAVKHDDAKLTGILQKTWAKMSPAGQRAALALVGSLPAELQALVARAVVASPP
jgi:hypothetical protein